MICSSCCQPLTALKYIHVKSILFVLNQKINECFSLNSAFTRSEDVYTKIREVSEIQKFRRNAMKI